MSFDTKKDYPWITVVVREYRVDYNRRTHAREIRALLKRWNAFWTADRPWRLIAYRPWEPRWRVEASARLVMVAKGKNRVAQFTGTRTLHLGLLLTTA